jgi:hypothetical protein
MSSIPLISANQPIGTNQRVSPRNPIGARPQASYPAGPNESLPPQTLCTFDTGGCLASFANQHLGAPRQGLAAVLACQGLPAIFTNQQVPAAFANEDALLSWGVGLQHGGICRAVAG